MHMAQLATLHTTDPPGCIDCSCSAMSNSETAPVLSTCKQHGNACVPCRTTHKFHASQTAMFPTAKAPNALACSSRCCPAVWLPNVPKPHIQYRPDPYRRTTQLAGCVRSVASMQSFTHKLADSKGQHTHAYYTDKSHTIRQLQHTNHT
jgi:hypothetical protein